MFLESAPTEIYTLSLHDALPIFHRNGGRPTRAVVFHQRHVQRLSWSETAHAKLQRIGAGDGLPSRADPIGNEKDRKSTRLNSSHVKISYAVFCLKKKKSKRKQER